MSTFLDKNKKKGALAALLLFLRTRKTVIALLFLVSIASLVFLNPANIIRRFPGGGRVAAWIALKTGIDGGKRDYGDLLAVFRAAKDGGNRTGWSAFRGGGATTGGKTGSLDFVKGKARDLETGDAGARLPKPGTIGGVLNPDDAKNRGEGVALSEHDLFGERSGLVKTAFAGGFAGGKDMLSGGAFAAPGFFGGAKSATSGKLSDVVEGGLVGIKGELAKGTPVKGGAKGQLNSSRASTINSRMARGLVGTRTISGQRAFVQLAAQRGRAAISVAPNCTAGSGCPGEFASVNTGIVYDGGSMSGDRTDVLTTSIGGLSSPNLPDTGLADDYVRQAEQMDADAKKCREADELYGPQELANDQAQQALSNQFQNMDCGGGGCSKAKAKACMKMADQMKDLCRQTMATRCAHIAACPLTAGNTCSANECDGPAKTLQKITEDNGHTGVVGVDGTAVPIRTTTMDQGEEGAGCADSRQNVAYARQAAQNAIDAYRAPNCETLYASKLIVDKAKYMTKCSGPAGQVVHTCKYYAAELCSSAHACSNAECTGQTDACVISDLKGIEAFIQSNQKY